MLLATVQGSLGPMIVAMAIPLAGLLIIIVVHRHLAETATHFLWRCLATTAASTLLWTALFGGVMVTDFRDWRLWLLRLSPTILAERSIWVQRWQTKPFAQQISRAILFVLLALLSTDIVASVLWMEGDQFSPWNWSNWQILHWANLWIVFCLGILFPSQFTVPMVAISFVQLSQWHAYAGIELIIVVWLATLAVEQFMFDRNRSLDVAK